MIAWEQAVAHVVERMRQLDLAGEPECYSVSEAVYILAGRRASGLRVMRIPLRNARYSHWFLLGPTGELVDLTAGQFDGRYPGYRRAIRSSFYGRTSNLAKKLMEGAS